MAMQEAPVVGAVYEDEDEQSFEVINFDEDEGIVEIEYEDGSVDEIDIDSWYELSVERISDDEEEDEDNVETDEDEDEDDEDLDDEDDDEDDDYDDDYEDEDDR